MRAGAIRYAVIGTGMMGREHMRNIALLEGAEIAALADPNADSLAQAAAGGRAGLAQYRDHRDLLSAGGFDCVVIASPNDT
ncbi:MAG: Gfo/Idh/MocA family oxidoreductase, partial [Nitratireductor sp.]